VSTTAAVHSPSQPSRVLVVEDDAELRGLVSAYLQAHSFEPVGVGTLGDARSRLAAQRCDVVLADLQLGADNGLELVRELVVEHGPAVIITTARGDEADRVVGLELGADDYLVKPFSFRELAARIRTVLRRASARPPLRPPSVARFDDWAVDIVAFTARRGTDRVEFTAGEFAVLRAFLEHPGRVLRRSELLALTHGDDARPLLSRTIDVLVSRVRHKLATAPPGAPVIRTVRGEGYRFERPVHWELG
jgi:DNA-binding response OmpR family regulator